MFVGEQMPFADHEPKQFTYLNLSGWWYTYPSEKYEFVSRGDDIPNIWKNKKCSKPPCLLVNQLSHTSPTLIGAPPHSPSVPFTPHRPVEKPVDKPSWWKKMPEIPMVAHRGVVNVLFFGGDFEHHLQLSICWRSYPQ
jgi:hypothetical protein